MVGALVFCSLLRKSPPPFASRPLTPVRRPRFACEVERGTEPLRLFGAARTVSARSIQALVRGGPRRRIICRVLMGSLVLFQLEAQFGSKDI